MGMDMQKSIWIEDKKVMMDCPKMVDKSFGKNYEWSIIDMRIRRSGKNWVMKIWNIRFQLSRL